MLSSEKYLLNSTKKKLINLLIRKRPREKYSVMKFAILSMF